MWLKSFKVDNRTLSEIELVVLLLTPDDQFLNATEIIEVLDRNLVYWNPERGTIYPLLHRLTDQDLLEKNPTSNNLQFKRTSKAVTFLSSLLSSDELLAQFETTMSYLEIIATSIISIDPFAADEFLSYLSMRVNKLSSTVATLQDTITEEIEDDGWTDIDVN